MEWEWESAWESARECFECWGCWECWECWGCFDDECLERALAINLALGDGQVEWEALKAPGFGAAIMAAAGRAWVLMLMLMPVGLSRGYSRSRR